MSEIRASRTTTGVTTEVYPGGTLASLSLTARALALGPTLLATTILATVAEATAVANQRAKNALTGLSEAEFAVLGLNQDQELIERAESTTPETWRVP
jgi:type VI protein secretion system component VasA